MSYKKSVANRQSPAGKKAFSNLIEIILVTALTVILALITAASLLNKRNSLDLDSTTKQISALLHEAQSRSAAEENFTVWGVHFDNSTSTTPFYSLFKTAYLSGGEIGHYRLPSDVKYSTSSISQGASVDVTFSQISGLPSASTSITIYLTAAGTLTSKSSTISISSSGLISF